MDDDDTQSDERSRATASNFSIKVKSTGVSHSTLPQAHAGGVAALPAHRVAKKQPTMPTLSSIYSFQRKLQARSMSPPSPGARKSRRDSVREGSRDAKPIAKRSKREKKKSNNRKESRSQSPQNLTSGRRNDAPVSLQVYSQNQTSSIVPSRAGPSDHSRANTADSANRRREHHGEEGTHSKQKQVHRLNRQSLKKLIRSCNVASGTQPAHKLVHKLDHMMAEQNIRNQHITDTAALLNSFKDNYTYMYNTLMEYKEDERHESGVVTIKIADEYRTGKCDPTKLSSKYEQQNAYKKRKQLMQAQKRETARAYHKLPATIAVHGATLSLAS